MTDRQQPEFTYEQINRGMVEHPAKSKPAIPGELVYQKGCIKIYRQDAGMGEKEYRIFLDGDYYCCVDSYEKAREIVSNREKACPRSTPSSATEPIPDRGQIKFDWLKAHDAITAQAARKDEREKVLDALNRDFRGRYVEDAVAEIRRFPESLRSGVP